MKAIGVVVVTEFAITFPLPGSCSYCGIGKAVFRILQFYAKQSIWMHRGLKLWW